MPIRRVQHPDDPVQMHRVYVDKKTHPLLHAALMERGIGAPRLNFIRDTLEAVLAGGGALAPTAGRSEPFAEPMPTPTPAPEPAPEPHAEPPTAVVESAEDLAARKARASTLFQRSGF